MENELLALTGTTHPVTKNVLSTKVRWAVQRDGCEVAKNALIANMHEQGRFLLTKTALENLAVLSSLESYLIQYAPYGQDRVRMIVDAYAMGAGNRILRW